jgi:RND family efflux transporter MFP subunit
MSNKPTAGGRLWWKSRRTKRVLAGVLVLLAGAFVFWLFFIHPYVSTDDARVEATLVRMAPDRVGGRIIKLNVDVGSQVKKGEILVELDHRTANAAVERAQAQTVFTRKELDRTADLVRRGSFPQRALDTAQVNADKAHAQLVEAQVELENTTIRSPLNGVVVQKLIEEGDVVQPGQTLLTLADIDAAWISANVEETSVGAVRIGQPVQISVDEGGDLTGRVLEIRHATAAQFALIPAENPSGNFTKLVQRIPVKVALDPHPNQTLRAGQSVEIKIRVK